MAFIKFLGTAGARFVLIKQLRASGGIWFCLNETQFLVDPGPGTLVRALKSRPPLNPGKLTGIFLSHKHLDHSGDVNVMIEAMTNGGFSPRGVLLSPGDALEGEPVIFKYLRSFLNRIEILKAGGEYQLGQVSLKVPVQLQHGVETYGFIMTESGKPTIGYLPDTRFFQQLPWAYAGCSILIINTVLLEPRPDLYHLSLPEAEIIIRETHPKKAILTHFGMSMLKARIWEKQEEVSRRTGVEVIMASDGLTFPLD
ncbi:MAG: MBL fold metallo-hydrolase [Candidatus Omnitrophica bacterium]|nr:MBL fold metallo-hydrolase [Candidatus Omnitrophota bacterium]